MEIKMKMIESTEKAAQCAAMIVSDLQEMNRSGDALFSLMILPEIEKARSIELPLCSIAFALQSKEVTA